MMVLKTLIGISKKCVDDGSLEVREKALMIMAKIQAKVFEGSMKKEL